MIGILNKKNLGKKRGVIGMILLFVLLFTIVIAGFMAVMIVSSVDYVSDELTPIMEDLGMAGETNMSEISGYTFGNANKIVQALPWLVALSYGMALVFCFIFVMGLDITAHPVFMGFYFALIILLIFGCVIMSNMYQDIYSGSDEIAIRLKDQAMMSWMILQSPFVMAFIAIISGIILFSRSGQAAGGFGV